ncbi:MAG: S-layer homology domain-containing protein [Bacillota bacterium]|nr:S-layer homology domain-containing protein [Bacillota bacterium]
MKALFRILFLGILCLTATLLGAGSPFEMLFADAELPGFEGVRIEGAIREDAVSLGSKELSALPIRSKVQKDPGRALGLSEREGSVEGIRLSYLLKEFCGFEVREADVLLIDRSGNQWVIQKYSHLVDEEKAFALVRLPKNLLEAGESAETQEAAYFLLGEEGFLRGPDGSPFAVDVIKINSGLKIKEMPSPTPSFSDLEGEYAYAKSAVTELSKLGILEGVSETEFAPQNPIDRAYLSKVLVQALDLKPVTYNNTYNDVQAEDWYAPYVASVVAEGLLNGYTDGSFGPNNRINRQEFASLCAEIAIKTGKSSEEEIMSYRLEADRFRDGDSVFGWVAHSIAYLDSKGAFDPYVKDEFQPLKAVNRAEAAYILYLLLLE